MPTYDLQFVPSALREWNKLTPELRSQFARKLNERCANPHVAADRLAGMGPSYKIKLRSVGYRLVYEIFEARVIVMVLSIGKREGGKSYRNADKRRKTR